MQQLTPRTVVVLTLVLAVLAIPCLTTAAPQAADSGPAATAQEPETAQEPQYVVYYFHGNVRCATCRKLEAYSEEAITKGFADQLASGTMAWRTVNIDEEQNKHFVTELELTTKSLVLVEYKDGKMVRFENLRLIWQLVGSKDGFLTYVRDSTNEFLGLS